MARDTCKWKKLHVAERSQTLYSFAESLADPLWGLKLGQGEKGSNISNGL